MFDSSRAKPKIRVGLVNGARFKADSGRAGPDVLLIYRHKTTDTIPLHEVASIETHHFNVWKTIGLVVGSIVALWLVAVIQCFASDCMD